MHIESIEPPMLVNALAVLNFQGVAVFKKQAIWASRCTRHLDSLDLISI